jgi:hypothetical protein
MEKWARFAPPLFVSDVGPNVMLKVRKALDGSGMEMCHVPRDDRPVPPPLVPKPIKVGKKAARIAELEEQCREQAALIRAANQTIEHLTGGKGQR